MSSSKRDIPDRFLGNHQHEKKRSRAAPQDEDRENKPTASISLQEHSPSKTILPVEIAFGKRGTRSLGGAAVVRTRTLYFANVPFTATAEEISALLAPYGRVAAVRLPKMNGRPSGRAYVDVAADGAAQAVAALQGCTLGGRRLTVELAREAHSATHGKSDGGSRPSTEPMLS